MQYIIPNSEELNLNTIILDLNGTLTVGGKIVSGVEERLIKLRSEGFKIIFFSGDTRGNANEIAQELNIEFIKASNGEEKKQAAKKLNPENCVAIGNGLIDLEMMKITKLSIVTLQAEGVYSKTLLESDIVVPSINDALDLLLDKERLVATLRK